MFLSCSFIRIASIGADMMLGTVEDTTLVLTGSEEAMLLWTVAVGALAVLPITAVGVVAAGLVTADVTEDDVASEAVGALLLASASVVGVMAGPDVEGADTEAATTVLCWPLLVMWLCGLAPSCPTMRALSSRSLSGDPCCAV